MNYAGNKIGIFGGTFDPIHMGHLIIADTLVELKKFDSIIFIPSARPPHKGRDIMFSADERFDMLSAAVRDDSRFFVSDIEMKREGMSFTIDTIREMKSSLPGSADISFIVGMDSLYDMEMWKSPHDIVSECHVIAARRVCDATHELPHWLTDNVEIVDVPLIEISSSSIRDRIRRGKSIRYLVPDPVIDMIASFRI